MPTFGEKIKQLRNLNEFTQEEFAKKTKVSIQTLRKYEQESKKYKYPDLRTVKKIADFCNVTTDSLIYDEREILSRDALNISVSELKISHNALKNLKNYNYVSNLFLDNNSFCLPILKRLELLTICNSILCDTKELFSKYENEIDEIELKKFLINILNNHKNFIKFNYGKNLIFIEDKHFIILRKKINGNKKLKDERFINSLTMIKNSYQNALNILRFDITNDFYNFIKALISKNYNHGTSFNRLHNF